MNQVIIYHFIIKAVSPVYFGDSQAGELVMNSENKPILLGNTIGGALRDYLKKTTISEETILKYMGGVESTGEDREKKKFRESGIYISDGEVNCYSEICTKEGTAIDSKYGTARKNQKYTLNHLPEGTEICFRIECDRWVKPVEKQILCPAEFEKLIGTWAHGIAGQKLLLGGQKNNGFGKFEMKELKKTIFSFNNSRDLDEYIFTPNDKKGHFIDWTELDYYELKQKNLATFSMTGKFPYGVYQGFSVTQDNSKSSYALTGLQKKQGRYFLPATSLKGLIRSEFSLLLKRMIGSDEVAKNKCNELFGDTQQRGKLVFSDVYIEDGEKIEIARYERRKDGKTVLKKNHPVYIKIDRLTGGAYSSALKHQQEIQGDATIQFNLIEENRDDGCNPYIFPLIYVMRRIGAGLVPLGGRTAIGLGQFVGSKVRITSDQGLYEIETEELLSEENKEWLKKQFDSFKRWCDNVGETISS